MLTTLYGTGSITVTRDKDVFFSDNGVIVLPEDLAVKLIETGKWFRQKPADPQPDDKIGLAMADDLKKNEDEPAGA